MQLILMTYWIQYYLPAFTVVLSDSSTSSFQMTIYLKKNMSLINGHEVSP